MKRPPVRLPRHLALLLTGGLLSACSITPAPPSGEFPGGGTSYTVSGEVLAPGVKDIPAAQTGNWSAPHVAGQVLVRSGGLSAQQLAPAARSALAGIRTQTLSSAGLTLAYTPAGQSDAAFAAKLARSGLSAQPNYFYRALAVPNDPGVPGNAGVKVGAATYDQDYLTRINAQGGWNALSALGKTPVGAVTAILDSGVDLNHPDLAGRLLPGRDFCPALLTDDQGNTDCVGEDNDPSDLTTTSVAGHGTASAGLLGAATNNGLGLAGLTWSGRTILPIKVIGVGGSVAGATTASLTAGVNYAVAQGARVINLSLGLTGPNTDPALAVAIGSAAAADVVLVAAAGNTPGDGLYYPASDPHVLAVGALGRSDALACYSARPQPGQKALDLVAPGGNAGTGTSTCNQFGPDDLLVLGPNGGYRLDAGTSFAAPQVSGAAALIRALRPDLTASQVGQVLTGSARTVPGGKLLDVGAAIAAAEVTDPPVTPPEPHPTPEVRYTLQVEALQGGTVVGQYRTSGVRLTTPQRLPYTIADLPAGRYVLSATLTVGSRTSSGQVNVTLGGDTTLDIPTE
ncbi:serine protease [Deinococcus irradiatisoli]|uniref:Serine protease n=1 Tax=Deinococcus irradiatisoli TaxID=2202254 RepID=A0A2Z3JL81_9DEIO|nr:S8 family serine peptidase [Deinococcus irradiatisoli]AWN22024.1 serine protease [Deinococcus irradiatisoli]